MRVVLQRVSEADVSVGGRVVGSIGRGLLILVGVEGLDTKSDVDWVGRKILNLRVFPDQEGKMNHSLQEVAGEVLFVSQFTLYGDCRKGNRPSYIRAAEPQKAKQLYESLVRRFREKGVPTASGRFRASMAVRLVNDGPVTILLDSRQSHI